MFKSERELSKMIDHTLLKPNALESDLLHLCEEAIKHNFKMVAINQVWTNFCKSRLDGYDINVGAAIGFPLGQISISSKVLEAKEAILNGADEIDYVIHIGKLIEKDYDYIEDEMTQMVKLCKRHDVICKVIFENYYLSEDDIVAASKIAKKVKPHFIKTSTGFAKFGAKISDVILMKEIVEDDVLIKAAGGIRSLKTLEAMVLAGASRIGTSSGVKIINEYKEEKK